MRLSRIKFYNAVKLGRTELNFIDTNTAKHISIELKDNLIKLVNAEEGATVFSSIFNTVWFEPEHSIEESKSTKAASRT